MDTNNETDTGITKRQRLINEAVEDLVATRTDHNLVMINATFIIRLL